MINKITIALAIFVSQNCFSASIDDSKTCLSLVNAVTPLMWAAAEGDIDKVKAELVKCGVDFDSKVGLTVKTKRRINSQDDHGRTASCCITAI